MSVAQVERFFSHTPRWQIDRLIMMPLDWSRRTPQRDFWQGMQVTDLRHWQSYPFGADISYLRERSNASEVREQLKIADAVYHHCEDQGIELAPIVHVPKFTYNEMGALQQALPGLFDSDGEFDLSAAEYVYHLESTLDGWRDRYPNIAGFEVRICEGGTETVKNYTLEDLQAVDQWLPQLANALESYGNRHRIDIEIYAHHYHASRGTRRKFHNLIARHPSLWMLEDLTWPEEHVTLPYLGYLGEEWARDLAAANPLCVNFLLDAEYVGQGILPTVYPYWLQGGLRQCQYIGAAAVTGRVQRWDAFRTLENWNLLNTDVFCALARNPWEDPHAALGESVARRFGPKAAPDLTNLLIENERLVRMQTINGIDYGSHSAFPPPHHLHRGYFDTPLAMKAVSDLFAAPGTRLHGEGTDELTADREWRQQLRTVAGDSTEYLRSKQILVDEIGQLHLEAERLSSTLTDHDAHFVRTSYALWKEQARAFQLFTEAAAAHAQWVHEGCRDNGTARELSAIGTAMELMADEFSTHFGKETLFGLAPRLNAMAHFLHGPQPIG